MHPYSFEESSIGHVDIYNQKIIEILYINEMGLDSDFVQW